MRALPDGDRLHLPEPVDAIAARPLTPVLPQRRAEDVVFTVHAPSVFQLEAPTAAWAARRHLVWLGAETIVAHARILA